MTNECISADIETVENYLENLFHVPVGVCIADTQDIVNGALDYEIADLRRTPDPNCATAFQYAARIEWAPSNGSEPWRLMYVLYRREVDQQSAHSKPVQEAERRPLVDMPIGVQRFAHRYLSQLLAAAGGEWPILREMLSARQRAITRGPGRDVRRR